MENFHTICKPALFIEFEFFKNVSSNFKYLLKNQENELKYLQSSNKKKFSRFLFTQEKK